MANQTEEKKYNPTLTYLYNMKRGLWSPGAGLSQEEYDKFMTHVEVGSRIVVKLNKTKKNDKSPDAYLEIIPKEAVDAMRAEYKGKAAPTQGEPDSDGL